MNHREFNAMKIFIIEDNTNKCLKKEKYENINVREVKVHKMINRIDIRVYTIKKE